MQLFQSLKHLSALLLLLLLTCNLYRERFPKMSLELKFIQAINAPEDRSVVRLLVIRKWKVKFVLKYKSVDIFVTSLGCSCKKDLISFHFILHPPPPTFSVYSQPVIKFHILAASCCFTSYHSLLESGMLFQDIAVLLFCRDHR